MAKVGVTVTVRDAVSSLGDPLYLLVAGDGVLATEALPARGSVVIGRAPECDIRIDHGSISRTHATLFVDEPLRIADANSANGTWVHDQRLRGTTPVQIRLNEAVRLGSVTVLVQRRSAPLRPQRARSHDYFQDRLDDECTRAARLDARFTIAHVAIADGQDASAALPLALRDADLVAHYAPNELELMLQDPSSDGVRAALYRLETGLAERGIDARVGTAVFPRDGRDASALTHRARSRALGEIAELPASSEVVVADERMKALHELVARVAAADISVLLQGETGAGKEVIAELVHRQSERAKGPFVRLNCAALTETLLESELFGYEKGAFTGAVASKPGLLEVANGGVVFLDEVGELDASTQAKLLRVLDEKKVMRVGGLRPRDIDVRIISATNRDLEADVRDGRFRLDLLYRLNAMSIIVPPLRERPAEIPLLARKFAQTLAAKLDRPMPRFTPPALALLSGYSWPGNVRELRNVIERALILCADDTIDARDLPFDKMSTVYAPVPVAAPVLVEPPIPPSEDAEERRALLEALETCAGNQTSAARLLGISRRTLINRLEKHALPRPRKRGAPP